MHEQRILYSKLIIDGDQVKVIFHLGNSDSNCLSDFEQTGPRSHDDLGFHTK